MTTEQTTDTAEQVATEQIPAAVAAADLAEQLRYAYCDESATYPQEWADRADPTDWQDYVAPAPGDSRWIATIWQDNDASINDFDCYGKVSQYAYDYTDSRESTRRPEGFDGSARKIQVDRGSWMWWQPYRDEDGKVYDSPEDVREVRDLLEMGFRGVSVERQQVGPCGHWHTADVASLGGIDSLANGYLAEVARVGT
jgi:hypothetical protein